MGWEIEYFVGDAVRAGGFASAQRVDCLLEGIAYYHIGKSLWQLAF
jgi:hypothetical protein